MKLFNPITPSNRHRTIIFKNILENTRLLNKEYNVYDKINKSFIQGKIIQNTNNIIEIDAGLQSNIEISEKEFKDTYDHNAKTGDYFSMYLYKTEYHKGDQLLNYKILPKKLNYRKRDLYYEYKLFKILLNNNRHNILTKGILLGNYKRGIKIGVGGKVSKLYRKKMELNYHKILEDARYDQAYVLISAFFDKISVKYAFRKKKKKKYEKDYSTDDDYYYNKFVIRNIPKLRKIYEPIDVSKIYINKK
uniref:Ribosomal protein S1 n=1 Tax=Malawimonas jakobiformis TaxID=136089 RepID=Q9G897_MALJA|nr:ribosomal protein S1 [Malawimonas jakobiformis]AAG13676.1 ribosomal protein S1 [Malawimonas jakobiformis]